jgi:hypothetical protein
MYRSNRLLPPAVVPILVVVAIIAYLFGVHRSSAPAPARSASASASTPGGEARTAAGSNVVLDYPASWQPVSSIQSIPGLAITHPLLLAPGGAAARAGLLSGLLPADASSPLPASFLALVHGVPHAEVVDLGNVQAYRYSGLNGYHRVLDVYVVPVVGSSTTALVCYAATGSAAYLAQCQQIVANATLVGQSSYELTPNSAYAARIAALLGVLDRQRLALRRDLHERATLSAAAPLASALAARFADTAASLSPLEPPPAASGAQTVLVKAIVQARGAYEALATAAGNEEPEAYAAAQSQVEEAETAVDAALEGFVQLGYNHT